MVIGGREFRVVDLERRTVRHDGFLMALLMRVGIDRMVPEDGEDAAAFALRILQRIIEQGVSAELAAAFLLPAGQSETDWAPETAAEIRAHLERANTEEDRSEVYRISAEQVLGFFRHRLRSLETSLSSLAAELPARGNRAAA